MEKRESKNTEQTGVPDTIGHRTALSPSQPVFNWNTKDNYMELKMKVTNIFLTKDYDIHDAERVPIITNWLGREGQQFTWALRAVEQETCKTVMELFDWFRNKFKP